MTQRKWIKRDDEKKALKLPYEAPGETVGDIYVRIRRLEGLIQKAKNRKKRYERLIDRGMNVSDTIQKRVSRGIQRLLKESGS